MFWSCRSGTTLWCFLPFLLLLPNSEVKIHDSSGFKDREDWRGKDILSRSFTFLGWKVCKELWTRESLWSLAEAQFLRTEILFLNFMARGRAHFQDMWQLLSLPSHEGTTRPPPYRSKRLPRDTRTTAGALLLKALLIQKLAPPLETGFQPIFWVVYSHRDKTDFLPTRFSCVSRSTRFYVFFLPFLLPFLIVKTLQMGIKLCKM